MKKNRLEKKPPAKKKGPPKKANAAPSREEGAFILCRRRKNQPLISTLVCANRCPRRLKCAEYGHYLQPGLFDHLKKRRSAKK